MLEDNSRESPRQLCKMMMEGSSWIIHSKLSLLCLRERKSLHSEIGTRDIDVPRFFRDDSMLYYCTKYFVVFE